MNVAVRLPFHSCWFFRWESEAVRSSNPTQTSVPLSRLSRAWPRPKWKPVVNYWKTIFHDLKTVFNDLSTVFNEKPVLKFMSGILKNQDKSFEK